MKRYTGTRMKQESFEMMNRMEVTGKTKQIKDKQMNKHNLTTINGYKLRAELSQEQVGNVEMRRNNNEVRKMDLVKYKI